MFLQKCISVKFVVPRVAWVTCALLIYALLICGCVNDADHIKRKGFTRASESGQLPIGVVKDASRRYGGSFSSSSSSAACNVDIKQEFPNNMSSRAIVPRVVKSGVVGSSSSSKSSGENFSNHNSNDDTNDDTFGGSDL